MKLQKQPDGELLEGFLFSFFCLFCIASMGVKRSLPQTPMGTDTKLCHSLQSKDWEEEPCRSELSDHTCSTQSTYNKRNFNSFYPAGYFRGCGKEPYEPLYPELSKE